MAKRKTLSYQDKVKLIETVDAGNKKKSDIAKEFGIPANTLSTILKNREKYERQGTSCKRIKGPEFKDVDESVYQWLKQCRDKNLPVSGPILKEKAAQFAAQLNKPDFRASNGWLQNFKKRNEVIFKKVTGESASVDDNVCTEWSQKLPDLVKGYKPDDIFNADETGLFYQCLPDKTLTFKGDTCHGGKNSKQRVTLLLGTNQIGTVKLKPLMIGKSKNPRCFKGVQSFPMDYTSNKKSWMNSGVFEKWLTDLDRQMKKKKKKILLFIDNATAHGDIPKMKNVKIEFLPPNTTSKLQPLDQGIIKNFKVHYRKEVVRLFLRDLEDKNPTKISILDAMWMASKAWNNVTENTIKNCFKKSGFKQQVDEEEESVVEDC
ncbi:tigger transposable element-derived protein 4-like [Homalodisca vitripennis]|uniref:tigger transposable element-derived protein 4-like n=1 Tax=Homalodisca vitripennis TaxID=197043 RepID=UPI001EEC6AFA|nr:tigger transposable element-derived protein 4-like [Homalodisca vitripennis]